MTPAAPGLSNAVLAAVFGGPGFAPAPRFNPARRSLHDHSGRGRGGGTGASKRYDGPRPCRVDTRAKRLKPSTFDAQWVGVPFAVREPRPAVTPARLAAFRVASGEAARDAGRAALTAALATERRPAVRERLSRRVEALSR